MDNRRRGVRRCAESCVVAFYLAVAACLLPLSASAASGAGIQAGPVEVATPVPPGTSVRLPSLYVFNPGTDSTTYHVAVVKSPGPATTSLAVPLAWIGFAQNDIVLKGGEHAFVGMSLAVPPSAPDGDYRANLRVEAKPGPGGQVLIAAAAETGLHFRVGPLPPQPFRAPAWMPFAALAVVVIVGVWLLGRAMGIRIEVGRRPR